MKHISLVNVIIILLAIGIMISNYTELYASDKYKIEKSIFGFYLGEHIDSLNRRLKSDNLFEADIGRTTYPRAINNSEMVNWITIHINKNGFVDLIEVAFKDNSIENYIALRDALSNSWGVKPECTVPISEITQNAKRFDKPHPGKEYNCLYELRFGSIKLQRYPDTHSFHEDKINISYGEIHLFYIYSNLAVLELEKEEL